LALAETIQGKDIDEKKREVRINLRRGLHVGDMESQKEPAWILTGNSSCENAPFINQQIFAFLLCAGP
jgi:hypothetical protein